MSNATEIRAQLAEAWESAERVAPQKGDTYIHKSPADGSYSVGTAKWKLRPDVYRILKHAKPEPKHEAVVASCIKDEENRRQVFAKTPGGNWESYTRYVHADELVDPVPLVEMPEREALVGAIRSASPTVWPLEGGALADAVLELLEGKREA